MNTKVLVADQYPIINLGILNILRRLDPSAEMLPMVNNGTDLASTFKNSPPNILFLELDLPETSGIQTIKDLKEINRTTKIIVFSHQPDEIYALSTIKAGASAYVSKNLGLKLLEKAYSIVKRGGIYLSENLNNQLKDNNFKNNHYNSFRKLSSREVEVLNLLSAGKRNKEIANKLEINEKTVSTYKTRILKKLKASTIAELITQSRILQIR